VRAVQLPDQRLQLERHVYGSLGHAIYLAARMMAASMP
jgi:hypothetical protein